MRLFLHLQEFCMLMTTIYISIAFVTGFGIAWVLGFTKLKTKERELKSATGYLESERMIKDTLQKELAVVHRNKMAVELKLSQKLKAAEKLIEQMDGDILLMQSNYEETESLLEAKQPEVHALKLELIEAKNQVARLKGILIEKEKIVSH